MSFTNPYRASRLTVDLANSLANGLVGFWPLTDGGSSTTAKDITSNANDGTGQGGVNWDSSSIGTVFASDKTTDSYFVSNYSASGQSAISLSFWFIYNFDGDSPTGWNGFFRNGDSSNLIFNCFHHFTNHEIVFQVITAGGVGLFETTQSGSWTAGQIYHAAFTYDGTTATVYLDGVEQSSGTHPAPGSMKTAASQVLNIGTGVVPPQSSPSGSTTLDGDLQNVRIYNRALSATEVATLYNRPWESTNFGTLWPYSPPAPADATLSTDTAATSLNVDLEGWWLATDNTGTTLVDVSGNGRDATLYGTNTWVSDSVGTVNRFDNSLSDGNNARTADTQPDLSGGYTVAFWVKHEELKAGTNRYGGGLALTDGAGTGSWWSTISSDVEIYFNSFSTSNSQHPIVVHNRNGGTIAFDTSDSNKNLDNDEWHFWSVTHSGTTITVYKDGAQINQNTSFNAPNSTTGKHIVINGVADTATGLNCSMQNIRLYSRALSADEVTLLYERPFEGIEYGDAFHYDPPTPANLTPLTSDSINTSQIAWYPLTETDDYASGAADISGSAATFTKAGSVTSDVSSLGTTALFDGVNGTYLRGGTSLLASPSAMTVSAWAKLDTYSSGAGNGIVSRWGSGSASNQFLLYYPANGTGLRFFVTDGSTNYIAQSTRVPTDFLNRYVHFVGTWDGTDVKLYIDGVEDATIAGPSSINSGGTDNIRIGNYVNDTHPMDGNVANVRIWSRALSEAEVWSIYENPFLGSAYTATPSAVLYDYILRSKRFRRLG